jgi:hypothetical protein
MVNYEHHQQQKHRRPAIIEKMVIIRVKERNQTNVEDIQET